MIEDFATIVVQLFACVDVADECGRTPPVSALRLPGRLCSSVLEQGKLDVILKGSLN